MFCPFCGERIAQAVQLCPHCGKKVETATLSEADTTALPKTPDITEPKSKGGLLNVILPIVSLLLIMKLGAGLYENDNDLRVDRSSGSVSSVQSKKQEGNATKANTTRNLQHEESIGSVQLVDGRVLEWFSNSPAALCYKLKSFTPMQMNQFHQVFDGQNIYVYGEVTGVYEDGTIVIHCIDEEASEAAGLSWPMMASVTLHTSESRDLLMQLSEGDEVVAIGAIHSGSYSSPLGVHSLELLAGELILTPYSTRLPK